MKPAPFQYHAAESLDEALDLLAEQGDDAKVLAGGQSLVPLMNFRLARPEALIDLNGVASISYVRSDEGGLRIGAMARQRAVERSALVEQSWPLLTAAVRNIGHVHIRNRGTIGGSLAHADPAAELPAAILALNAELRVRDRRGSRVIAAAEFFTSHYTTTLEPDEILVEIQVPALSPRTGWAFEELTRRHGDFALVGAAALVTRDEAGIIQDARLVLAGCGPTPMPAAGAERLLQGQRPSEELFRAVGEQARAEIDPDSDVHADAAYRRTVAAVVARRALSRACERLEPTAR